MFGNRIGFLKFKADIFDKETGKKVFYQHHQIYLLNLTSYSIRSFYKTQLSSYNIIICLQIFHFLGIASFSFLPLSFPWIKICLGSRYCVCSRTSCSCADPFGSRRRDLCCSYWTGAWFVWYILYVFQLFWIFYIVQLMCLLLFVQI